MKQHSHSKLIIYTALYHYLNLMNLKDIIKILKEKKSHISISQRILQ